MVDWVNDINEMHEHYKVHSVVKNMDKEMLAKFLDFRFNFLQEEIDEGKSAITANDPEEIVDALIDLCVVAIGTLDLLSVDCHKAWQEVLKANMNKEVGIKEGRPNPLGMPDLIKPPGWQAPAHTGNHGLISNEQ